MNHQRAAEVQIVLEGVPLPATRAALIRYASLHDSAAAVELEQIADRTYDRLDDVGEQLLRVQPAPPAEQPLPRAESGAPPGGDDYVNPKPKSGAVRVDAPADYPAQKQIDAASETLKKQVKVQEQGS
jgi:hypothetical protein